jgi:hypothetical protein
MTSNSAVPISPERLVGIGFRGWLAGYEYQDISAWELVWNTYATALGPKPAKRAVSELSSWVRQVHQSSCRRIETYPSGCAGFCRDECIAISVIAACQHDNCPALRACAFALLDSPNVDPMLDEATEFARLLLEENQQLSPSLICNVAAVPKVTKAQLPC